MVYFDSNRIRVRLKFDHGVMYLLYTIPQIFTNPAKTFSVGVWEPTWQQLVQVWEDWFPQDQQVGLGGMRQYIQ